jgi:hypothetical protein
MSLSLSLLSTYSHVLTCSPSLPLLLNMYVGIAYSPKILMAAPTLLQLLANPFIHGVISIFIVSFGLVFLSLPRFIFKSVFKSMNEKKKEKKEVCDK